MKDVFIIDGLRTPIGKMRQSLKGVSPITLGAGVIKALLEKHRIEGSLVDEVIIGNVVSAGLGQNPARQVAINAGLPVKTPAFTVNKVCGSGLKSVILATQAILCRDSDLILAGGIESASRCPYVLPRSKKSKEIQDEDLFDSLISDGLWCNLNNTHMGTIAEYTAKKFSISREEQDTYAFNSHKKACEAQEKGLFLDEIVPVSLNGDIVLSTDERPRKELTLEKLSILPAAFGPGGSVTAGNSSAPADGAAVLAFSSSDGLKKNKLKPIAQILGYATVAVEPNLVFTAPALALKECLKASSLKISDVDIFDINEAFSVQAILTLRLGGLDNRCTNIFGGDVAIGHPLGLSGTRDLVTILNILRLQRKKIGIISVSIGGGSAVSLAVRMIG